MRLNGRPESMQRTVSFRRGRIVYGLRHRFMTKAKRNAFFYRYHSNELIEPHLRRAFLPKVLRMQTLRQAFYNLRNA